MIFKLLQNIFNLPNLDYIDKSLIPDNLISDWRSVYRWILTNILMKLIIKPTDPYYIQLIIGSVCRIIAGTIGVNMFSFHKKSMYIYYYLVIISIIIILYTIYLRINENNKIKKLNTI